MSEASNAATFTGIELLLNMLDRTAAAGEILRRAHALGRQVTSAELMEVRADGERLLADLDDAIMRAQAEGR